MRNGITWVEVDDHGPRTQDRDWRSPEVEADIVPLKIAPPVPERKKKPRNMSKTVDYPKIRVTGSRAIALDGGTTNTRARLIQNGRLLATARREVGVRDAVLDDRRESMDSGSERRQGETSAGSVGKRLVDAVREAIQEVAGAGEHGPKDLAGPGIPDLIVAAGMLSSEVGLLAVPHVNAPAGIAELAAAVVVRTLPEVASKPIHFVPGVRTSAEDGPDGWMRADVMRGEECETLGACGELQRQGLWEQGKRHSVFLWPGSHTKLVEVDGEGRITRSQTTLAGELLQAVSRHSLIAASLPPKLPEILDEEAAEAGARASETQGLGRSAFLVRLAALQGAMNLEQRAAFWIGAVVADDVRQLTRHPILAASPTVWVGGREPLRNLYCRWLGRLHQGPVRRLADEVAEMASALGALAIAELRRTLTEDSLQEVITPR